MKEFLFSKKAADNINTIPVAGIDRMVMELDFPALLINDGRIVGSEHEDRGQ